MARKHGMGRTRAFACSAIYFIWSPRMSKGWKKTAVRTSGSLLLVVIAVSSCLLLLGSAMGAAPREHIVFTSGNGTRVALLSHSSFRDFSTTQVAVKADSCCTRYIAYDYQGDGDDFMGANSVNWVDDHNLVIRYAVDPSGVQVCHAQVSDIKVICEAHSEPVFDSNKQIQPQ